MIEIGKMYSNNARLVDIVTVVNILHLEGINTVVFTRNISNKRFKLPIEEFSTKFTRLPNDKP